MKKIPNLQPTRSVTGNSLVNYILTLITAIYEVTKHACTEFIPSKKIFS